MCGERVEGGLWRDGVLFKVTADGFMHSWPFNVESWVRDCISTITGKLLAQRSVCSPSAVIPAIHSIRDVHHVMLWTITDRRQGQKLTFELVPMPAAGGARWPLSTMIAAAQCRCVRMIPMRQIEITMDAGPKPNGFTHFAIVIARKLSSSEAGCAGICGS